MSFQQGLSGLNAASRNLEVIGHNVANANTYGAKASRAEFADMYATALGGTGTNNVGIGVNLAAVSQQFTQGNITTTENPMDLAISGNGFFQVSDGENPVFYTRNGQFKVDREGYIVNNAAQKLMGYRADGNGVIQPGVAVPLQLPTAGIDPHVTSEIDLEFNLDSREAVTQPTAGATIDFTDKTTYNQATSMSIFDDKGQDVSLTYYFQKAGNDSWNVYMTANGTSLSTDPVSGAATPVTTMNFPSNGGAPTAPTMPLAINIPSTTNANGATTNAITGIQLDMGGARQWGVSFGVTAATQDGYAPGKMTSLTVEDNGIITARYSNGQTKPAGQVEIANFRNPQGLQPLGGNAWAATYASGDPVVGVPTSGNLGSLQAGALEESNVDLTGELVNMITAQRVYQANAQTIKTQDTLMQTLVSLR